MIIYLQEKEPAPLLDKLKKKKPPAQSKLEKNKAEANLLKAQTSFPNVEQLNELLVKSLKSNFLKILSTHDFSSSLPSELKDLPSKFNDLTKEVKGLKNQVQNIEIELPEDLKEIPPKLEDFIKTVTSLTSQVAELKTLQWELPAEFLALPSQVEMVQAKLKNMDALPKSTDSDSNDETHVTGSMVEPSRTKKLKKFDCITEDGRHIHLTKEEINHQKKLKEDAKVKATKQEREVRKAELVDLLGPEGPITLKVYREDGTSEIIPNFKASDLHLGEWREVVKACPNKTGKGWEIIYKRIANKRLNSSVQYKDHLPGTVLNEPVFVPELGDNARTFIFLLLAEIDKTNLNPLKQMRVIEKLRRISLKEITPQLSFNHLAIPQARFQGTNMYSGVTIVGQSNANSWKRSVYPAMSSPLTVKFITLA
ncbi:hypothetical protein Tco_1049758 [Tanacetum coccineum]